MKEFEESIRNIDPRDIIVTFENDAFYEINVGRLKKKQEVYH